MINFSKKHTGFTIVELLIVIVVIAILATISIMAFNGIQDRAEVAKTTAAVRQYKNALMLYRTDNGSYPSAGGFCLGDQYGLFTGGSTAGCRYSTSVIGNGYGSSNRDLLRPYLGGQLPMPSTKFVNAGTTEFVGAHFYGSSYNYTLDGDPVVAIEYYVKSDACPVGQVYAYSSTGTFTSPSTSRSSALSNGSRCYLLLPNN